MGLPPETSKNPGSVKGDSRDGPIVGPPYGKDSHTIPILFPTTAGRGMTDHGDAYPGAVVSMLTLSNS